jgi:chitinase
LSAVRVVAALAVAGGLGAGAFALFDDAVDALRPLPAAAWYAPYVDTTLTPQFHFEDPADNPADQVVLGFVVANASGACEPTWGTHHSLDEAATTLDLDRRVARLRQRSGDVIVSFGGAINNELALRCSTVDELVAAYSSVLTRYDLTTIDFDIEGSALADADANARRAEATARLQAQARADGRALAVWLTLPVAPSGMTTDAVSLVDGMLAAGVDLAGVNVMTMNYGGSRPADADMFEASAQALEATWLQLSGAYRRAGTPLTDAALWRKVGATPMIGQNDAPGERFTLDDARRLADFAAERGLGRISIWSANRDGPCGAQWDSQLASNTCSGLEQEPLEFAHAFDGLTGQSGQAAEQRTVLEAPPIVVDDPATSPYPIWRSSRVYEATDKVVWHGNVYEAKWWTQGNLPDEPVVNVWDTPWRYVGPVLPTDRPRTTPTTAPPANYPEWSAEDVYDKGDRVLVDGRAFEARSWSRGDRPDDDVDRPWETPWELVED